MELAQAASEVLEPLGFEVLELSVSGQGSKRRLLLRIDRLDEGAVSTEDVRLAAEVFGLELDRLDPFDSPYQLEVESPGPERPLFTARHFERFTGLLAKVKTGGESFKGRIGDVAGGRVSFEVDGNVRSYALRDVQARLAEWPSEPR